ncbi:hypothetical protein Tco_0304078 [Tanacetum coccineum]
MKEEEDVRRSFHQRGKAGAKRSYRNVKGTNGPTSMKRDREFILVRQGSDLHFERCKDLAIEEAYTIKYYIHPGADMMLCGFRLTNRWLSMKEDIASYGSKYLAYLEVEVEYQRVFRKVANRPEVTRV